MSKKVKKCQKTTSWNQDLPKICEQIVFITLFDLWRPALSTQPHASVWCICQSFCKTKRMGGQGKKRNHMIPTQLSKTWRLKVCQQPTSKHGGNKMSGSTKIQLTENMMNTSDHMDKNMEGTQTLWNSSKFCRNIVQPFIFWRHEKSRASELSTYNCPMCSFTPIVLYSCSLQVSKSEDCIVVLVVVFAISSCRSFHWKWTFIVSKRTACMHWIQS